MTNKKFQDTQIYIDNKKLIFPLYIYDKKNKEYILKKRLFK